MCDVIRRRGPDDEGFYVDGPIGLGMRRLSIIDVDGGHQPIANEDGSLVIVFNGEIFNYGSLHAGLLQRGHRFKTRSDTETILHLFEEEGADCVRHFRGMFAFSIWNTRTQSLVVVRDRLGIKPLHYYFDGRRFIFGSEIKSILQHPAVSTRINWTALDAYFAYGFIPAPLTIYANIHKLRPGHRLIVDANGLRDEQYWDVDFEPKLTGSESDIGAEFLDRLRESVDMRLISEVPLGAFLSGGVDSSLIAALMAQSSAQPIKTFTIGFSGETGNFLDERPYAREVSSRYHTDHREFVVSPSVEEALDVALDAFDEPFADDSLIPTHHICQLARHHVTVALTGLGGDENFAGYERHLGFRLSTLAERTPWRQIAGLARPLVNAMRESRSGHYRINHLKRFLQAAHLPSGKRWGSYMTILSQDQRRRLFQPDIAREIDFDRVDHMGYAYFEQARASDPLDAALYQDLKFYLPDDILALTDRVGMWHSLELRVPFVDHTLVEFCARIPAGLKLSLPSGRKKHLLKRVAEPLIPASVLRHRKQGFASPMAMWLRGSLRGYVERALHPAEVQRSGILNPAMIQEEMGAHQRRDSLNDKLLFTVLMFERWWKRDVGTGLRERLAQAPTAVGD
jgi:asparagine synthase (glutamine-hydrolysing)